MRPKRGICASMATQLQGLSRMNRPRSPRSRMNGVQRSSEGCGSETLTCCIVVGVGGPRDVPSGRGGGAGLPLIGRRDNQLITRFNGAPMWDTPLTNAQTGGATFVPSTYCEAKGSRICRVPKPVMPD